MHEFFLSFVFIFLAALPGRTTFVLILLGSAMNHRRLLLGAIPAFVVQCGVAVLIGQVLKQVPHAYVQHAAGVLFLYFAAKFWMDSRKTEKLSDRPGHSVPSIFVLFFLAELGDVSQLAIAARAAEVNSALSVFIAATAAMSLIAVVAVFAGQILGKAIREHILQRIAAVVFAVLGVYLLLSA